MGESGLGLLRFGFEQGGDLLGGQTIDLLQPCRGIGGNTHVVCGGEELLRQFRLLRLHLIRAGTGLDHALQQVMTGIAQILQRGLRLTTGLAHRVERARHALNASSVRIPNRAALRGQLIDAGYRIPHIGIRFTVVGSRVQRILLSCALTFCPIRSSLLSLGQHLSTFGLSGNGDGHRIGILTKLDELRGITLRIPVRLGNGLGIGYVLVALILKRGFHLLRGPRQIGVLAYAMTDVDIVFLNRRIEPVKCRLVFGLRTGNGLGEIADVETELLGRVAHRIKTRGHIRPPVELRAGIIRVVEILLDGLANLGDSLGCGLSGIRYLLQRGANVLGRLLIGLSGFHILRVGCGHHGHASGHGGSDRPAERAQHGAARALGQSAGLS